MRIDMAIEYLGLSEINGPLVAVEGVRGAFYDEIVELVVEGKQKKLGRIVEINNDYAVVQVFESTEEMSLLNTHARLTGRPLCVGLSEEEHSTVWGSRSTGSARCTPRLCVTSTDSR